MRKLWLIASAVLLGVVLTQPAHAALNVFACEPEWAALAQELGGDKISVSSATTALQDPHHIEARPSLIARVRRADLGVCTGADLEAGWLPLLLRQAGNAKVQPGNPGYFEAAQWVELLEIPARVDRAEGDVHAQGNPHLHTDARNITRVAVALAARLAEIDASNAAFYRARHQDFAARWQAAVQRWEQQAAPLKDVPIVVQHRAWPYLNRWLGLREVAALEPKPGVEPSSAQLAAVLSALQNEPAKFIVRAAYHDARPSQWLAERAKLPIAVLPYTVGGSDAAQDLFGLFDDTIRRLLAAAQ